MCGGVRVYGLGFNYPTPTLDRLPCPQVSVFGWQGQEKGGAAGRYLGTAFTRGQKGGELSCDRLHLGGRREGSCHRLLHPQNTVWFMLTAITDLISHPLPCIEPLLYLTCRFLAALVLNDLIQEVRMRMLLTPLHAPSAKYQLHGHRKTSRFHCLFHLVSLNRGLIWTACIDQE